MKKLVSFFSSFLRFEILHTYKNCQRTNTYRGEMKSSIWYSTQNVKIYNVFYNFIHLLTDISLQTMIQPYTVSTMRQSIAQIRLHTCAITITQLILIITEEFYGHNHRQNTLWSQCPLKLTSKRLKLMIYFSSTQSRVFGQFSNKFSKDVIFDLEDQGQLDVQVDQFMSSFQK